MSRNYEEVYEEIYNSTKIREDDAMSAEEFQMDHTLSHTMTYYEYMNNPDDRLEQMAISRLETIRFLRPFGFLLCASWRHSP